jgi:hypothetical protein
MRFGVSSTNSYWPEPPPPTLSGHGHSGGENTKPLPALIIIVAGQDNNDIKLQL